MAGRENGSIRLDDDVAFASTVKRAAAVAASPRVQQKLLDSYASP
jgi:hypothetical protein